MDIDELYFEFFWFEGYVWLLILCLCCGVYCGFEFFLDVGCDFSYWSGEDWFLNGVLFLGEVFFVFIGIDVVWGGCYDDEGLCCLVMFLFGGDTAVDRSSFRREVFVVWARMYYILYICFYVE